MMSNCLVDYAVRGLKPQEQLLKPLKETLSEVTDDRNVSYKLTLLAFASQDPLDCNRAVRHVHIRLLMSKSSPTVLEPSCQLEDVHVTTGSSLLSGCHHLQPKRLQVSYIAVKYRCLFTNIIFISLHPGARFGKLKRTSSEMMNLFNTT